jgi:hypothetical protein
MTIRCSSDGDNSTIRQFDAKGAWWWRPGDDVGGMLEILDEKMGKNYFRFWFFSSRVERRES